MSHVLDVDFISLKDVKFAAKAAKTAPATTLVILAGADGALGKATKTILGEAAAHLARPPQLPSSKALPRARWSCWLPMVCRLIVS